MASDGFPEPNRKLQSDRGELKYVYAGYFPAKARGLQSDRGELKYCTATYAATHQYGFNRTGGIEIQFVFFGFGNKVKLQSDRGN